MASCQIPNVSVPLYIIVVLFSLSSWINIDGLWAELPLLVQHLPEFWALPSYLTIVTKLGSVAPLVYFIVNSVKVGAIRDVPIIYTLISIGLVSFVLQAFFWDKTAIIAGEQHSVAFLLLAFISALTNATSGLVFLAFMAHLPPEYMSALYVGDGLCGFLPSIAALIQGAGDYDCEKITINSSLALSNDSTVNYTINQVVREPLFPVYGFFILLAAIMAVSFTAFTLLNYLPWCRKFHVNDQGTRDSKFGVENTVFEMNVADTIRQTCASEAPGINTNSEQQLNNSKASSQELLTKKPELSTSSFAFLLAQYGFQLGMCYGVLYSIQSYSLLPYGGLAYNLGNRLTAIAIPIGSFVALFVPTRSVKLITFFTAIGTVASAYILVLASLSPDPPLKGTDSGLALAVVAWIIMSGSWGYAKVGIALVMRGYGKKQLMWTGATHILCNTMFSIVMFVCVAISNLFKDEAPCAQFSEVYPL